MGKLVPLKQSGGSGKLVPIDRGFQLGGTVSRKTVSSHASTGTAPAKREPASPVTEKYGGGRRQAAPPGNNVRPAAKRYRRPGGRP